MNTQTRIEKIQEIITRDKEKPFGRQEIPWGDGHKLITMDVFEIPLDYLVYNKYNGRILSRTKSLERQRYKIDVETREGKEIIAKLLWDSKIDRNENTLKSIKEYGQQKVGIITKDGIVIDGNRRVMLLEKCEGKYNYFKTVVLPVTLDQDPLAIERLETIFQMGEDEKLGYNPTEKYLKASTLYYRITNENEIDLEKLNEQAIERISDWMGEQQSEVRKYLRTMAVMDEYLNSLHYDGIYTQLDNREDQLLYLTKWLNNYYGESSVKAFDNYKDDDVDDLKAIAFDFIRIRNHYDGKEFRNLADGSRESHFFGNSDIWSHFSNSHFEILKNLPKEPAIDFNSQNLQAHLNDRDNKYFESSKNEEGENKFLENLAEHVTSVRSNKASNQPAKLVKMATQNIDSIKTGHASFSDPEVKKKVRELGDKIFKTLQMKSPLQVFNHIVGLLESIDIENIPEGEIEGVKEQTKKIQQIGYKINKSL